MQMITLNASSANYIKYNDMKPKENEKTLEARLVREIEARGGMALKYTSQFHRGIPDRICLLPCAMLTFVELKSTGKKPTKLQEHAMAQLRALDFDCRVIDSTEALDKFLQDVDRAIRNDAIIRPMREKAVAEIFAAIDETETPKN